MTTHIVCRDCEFEALVDDTDEAVEMVDTHESSTGHDVDDKYVGDGGKIVTDGGQPLLRFDDRGIQIPDGVDLSEGVVFRARGITTDHKPGTPNREFYPVLNERHLTADGCEVINENLEEFEVSIKPYGEEVETYRVSVAMADGGSEYADPLEAVDGETELEIECAVAIDAPRACDGWCETIELDEPADYTGQIIELPGFDWECHECGNPHEFEIEGIRVSNLV